jgi:transposase-like protein
MSKIQREFEQKGFEESQYNQYYRRFQVEYKRIKLRSVHLYSQGNEFAEIAEKLDIHSQSVRKYMNLYLIWWL